MLLSFQTAKDLLYDFNFHELFIEEMGWNQPVSRRPEPVTVEEVTYERSRIAEMAEVPVFEITAPDGEIPNGELRARIYKAIAENFAENLLIFGNGDRTNYLYPRINPGSFWFSRRKAEAPVIGSGPNPAA